MTLFADDPICVYHNARGVQLTTRSPRCCSSIRFGAGLGRWGMAAGVLSADPRQSADLGGDPDHRLDDRRRRPDDRAVRAARSSSRRWRSGTSRCATRYPRLAACARGGLAANLGTAVMVVSFTPFVAQIGIQYWFLAGALHGVACRYGVQDA